MARKLTSQQERFVDEYLVDLNATAAAKRAGYSEETAHAQAHRLLRHPLVRPTVEAAIAARRARSCETADKVVHELACMAHYDPADLAAVTSPGDIAALPEHVRRAIVGWGWDRAGNFVLKLASKDASLALLARHLGLLRDRLDVEHSGPGGGAIPTSLTVSFVRPKPDGNRD